MKTILGLDLGTNSIGWAVVKEAEESDAAGNRSSIAAAGSRIIPMDAAQLGEFDKGNSVSQTKERTQQRSIRRLYERHHLRRERLHRVLNIMGYLPEHYAAALDRYGKFLKDTECKLPWRPTEDGHYEFIFQSSFNEMLQDFYAQHPDLASSGQKIPYDWTLYYLRKKALTRPIDRQELAWLLLNFNQKRGYNQSREDLSDSDTETKSAKTRQYFDKQVVTEIIDTGRVLSRTNSKELIVVLADGSRGKIYKKEIPDWVGREKSIIATVDIDKEGRDKKDDDGMLSCRFRIPTEAEWDSEWELVKLKTEKDLDDAHKTVGAYIYDSLLKDPSQKIKGKLVRVIERKYYKEELQQILETQVQFHPELQDRQLYDACIHELYASNDAYRASIAGRDFVYLLKEDVLFYQRQLKKKKSLIADCPYESHRRWITTESGTTESRPVPIKCIARSHPLFQEFRLWQFVGNLRIYRREMVNPTTHRTEFDVDVTSEFLPDEESRARLFDWLNDRSDITQSALLKYKEFGLLKNYNLYRWNYVDDDKKAYPCNETRGEMLSTLKKYKLSPELLTPQFEEALWQILYAIDTRDELKKALATFADKHSLDRELFVAAFSKFKPFDKDYGAYSAKAIKRLLPLMRMGHHWSAEAIDPATRDRMENNQLRGLPLWQACYVVYNRHSESQEAARWTSPDDIDTYLRNFRQHSLRNPIVEQVVQETLRTVRDIWRQEGHIDEIHVELGREMKRTAKERARMTQQILDNESTNLRIKALLTEFFNPEYEIENVRPYSPYQQELLRIYEDGILSDPQNEQPDDIKAILRKFNQREASKRPTHADVMRYKLWLEQKYRSPYTGEFISLARLFTSDYEIEHVIPQARYFDDSLSNKVICESEVNKLKDKQLGYEFIKAHHGEKVYLAGQRRTVEIFSVEGYETFVKEHYGDNKSKMKKLLMEEIPEDFIARQMNDSRYISRLVTTLLSNIVREEGEEEAVSKHVIPCTGAITDRLKKDWGVNDVWNRLVLPRFERMNSITKSSAYTTRNKEGHLIPDMPLEQQRGFNKKRIDHRHHAMDAIVIACASRNIVNFLNNESARSGAKISRYDLQRLLCDRDRIIRAPWPSFPSEVYDVLSRIVVSFKQNLRVINKTCNHYEHFDAATGKKQMVAQEHGEQWSVRKSLHKDTVFGLVNLRMMKEVSLRDALKQPQRIVEKDLKQQILKLLRDGYDEKAVVAYFKEHEEVWHETNFKKIKVYYYTAENQQQLQYYAVRKPLDTSFTRDRILGTVTDTGIQKILLQHLEQCGNDPEKAFSPEGIEQMNAHLSELNNGNAHQPIYKVRTYEQASKFAIGQTGYKSTKFVEAAKGTNLFFAVYENEIADKKTGEVSTKRSYATIPLRLVIERQKQGLPPAPEDAQGHPAKFVLSPGDLVYVPTAEELTAKQIHRPLDNDRIYKMVSATGTRCYFIRYTVASTILDKVEFTKLNKVESTDSGDNIKEICIPIHTDRLGNILPSDDLHL